MNNHRARLLNIVKKERGFTLAELVICLTLMGILAAISIPTMLDYRKSLDWKQTARTMTTMLRGARSKAITYNCPQMVVFKPNSSSYSWISYSNANSSCTDEVVQKNVTPGDLTIKSTTSGLSSANVYAQFNTNGTVSLKAPSGAASDGNVSINEGTTQKYLITITNTGRVNLVKK